MSREQDDGDVLIVNALAHAAGEVIDCFKDCDATGPFIDQRSFLHIGIQAPLGGGDLLSVAKYVCDIARILGSKMKAELIDADGEHVQHRAGRFCAARGGLNGLARAR